MQTMFKVVYSLVVAILFVLSVILGTRTLYADPEEPQNRHSPGGAARTLSTATRTAAAPRQGGS